MLNIDFCMRLDTCGLVNPRVIQVKNIQASIWQGRAYGGPVTNHGVSNLSEIWMKLIRTVPILEFSQSSRL